jgi:hypothetical protein
MHNPGTRGRAGDTRIGSHTTHDPVSHSHNDDTIWCAGGICMNSHAAYLQALGRVLQCRDFQQRQSATAQ